MPPVARGGGEAAPASLLVGAPLCLTAGRLASPDSLLQRRLGTPIKPVGGWASASGPLGDGSKWEGIGAFDEYEDAGGLKLVPESVLWDLGNSSVAVSLEAIEEALAALERARRGGYATGVGIAWAGQWVSAGGQGDPRVSPLEAQLGPLDPISGLRGPAPPYPFTFANAGDGGAAQSQVGGRPGNTPGGAPRGLFGTAADPEMPGIPRLVKPSPPPPPPTTYHDRLGRRLLAWPADPTSTCSAVCVGRAEQGPGITLNLQEFRDEDPGRAPTGMGGGASSSFSQTPGYGLGFESILGAQEQPGLNASAGTGQQWDATPPTATQRITGRLLPTGGSAAAPGDFTWAPPSASPTQPRPSSSYPSSIHVLPAGAAPALARNASAPCGPVLRLTPSLGGHTGAAWYARGVDVREGFDTTFLFRLANPSSHCRTHSDVATRCVSGGGAGFAFVAQTAHPAALGNGSSGLGYAGLSPSLAVEFDSWSDWGLGDPGGDTHVSVHSRGASAGNSANHTFSLGSAHPPGGLHNGMHSARVRYTPGGLGEQGAAGLAARAAFVASPHVTSLMLGAARGGAGWGGLLEVWVDAEGEAEAPLLAVPCDLDQLLSLGRTQGRAWVGFTAATGDDIWEQHDILAWHFSSLRRQK